MGYSEAFTNMAIDAAVSLLGFEAMDFNKFRLSFHFANGASGNVTGFVGAGTDRSQVKAAIMGAYPYPVDYKVGVKKSSYEVTMRMDSALELFGDLTDMLDFTAFGMTYEMWQTVGIAGTAGIPVNKTFLTARMCQFTDYRFDTDRGGGEILLKARLEGYGEIKTVKMEGITI